MPRSSGVYSLPAGNPVVTGTTISSSGWGNPTMSDIAAALTQSISQDGQTPITANLPMSGFKHTGVANGVSATDYAAYGQVTTQTGYTYTNPIINGATIATSTFSGTTVTASSSLQLSGSVNSPFNINTVNNNAGVSAAAGFAGINDIGNNVQFYVTSSGGGSQNVISASNGNAISMIQGGAVRLTVGQNLVQTAQPAAGTNNILSVRNTSNTAGAKTILQAANDAGNGCNIVASSTVDGAGVQIYTVSAASLSLGTNSSNHFSIDSGGRWVNAANTQPAFGYYITAGGGAGTLVFNTALWTQRGAGYAAGTGIFTAPVTGLYSFGCAGYISNTSGSSQAPSLTLQYNGAATIWQGVLGLPNGFAQSLTSPPVLMYMTAGDTMRVVFGASACTLQLSQGTQFSGQLIS